MTPTLQHSLAPLLLALLCGHAAAQAVPDPLFKRLDKNADGKVTREELPRNFDRLDANKDGVVTPEEVAQRRDAPAAPETKPATPEAKPAALPEAPDASAGTLLSLLSKPAIDLLLVVSDLDRTTKFYRDGIGMKAVGERAKLVDGSSLQRLQWGHTVFHLVAPAAMPALGPKVVSAGEDVKQQIIAANGLRLIYLLVDDKDGVLARLKERGITPEGGASAAGSYELFADPDGNPVAVQSTAPRRGGTRRPQSLQMAHTVSDDAVARRFFGETLGFPAAGSIPLRSMGATEYRHAVGESVIKFWAPTVTPQRESLGGPVLDRIGARAVIFPMRELDAVKTILAARGLKTRDETVPALAEKPALVISDFDGNRILFLEQPATGPAPSTPSRPATTAVPGESDTFARFDKNRDGVIAKDELRNEQVFARLDANKDGKLSRDEVQRVIGGRANSRRSAPAAPAADIKPRTPTHGGPLLFDGTPGDATSDAAGETQIFEQTFIKGLTDVPVPAQGMAWVDLNGDGRADLVIVEKDRIRLLLNRGGFEFAGHPLALDGELTGSQAPSFADFNGDGFLDFYLSTVGGRGRANFFLSQGAWDRFKDFAVQMGVDNAGAYARGQVSLADVNGDGWLDMAIAANQIGSGGPTAGRPLSRLYVFQPANDGVFEHGKFEDEGGTEVVPRFGGVDREKPDRDRDINGMSAVLRDLDGDGATDLIRAAHNDMLHGDPLSPFASGDRPYGVFAWRNESEAGGALKFTELMPGPGSFTEHGRSRWDAAGGHYVTEQPALAAETILPADIDNDGDLDLLITGITGPEVIVHSLWTAARVWRNDGGMKFTDITASSGLGALNWFADKWAAHWSDTIAEDGRANAKRGETPLPRGEQRFALKDHQLYFGNSTWADFNNDGWIDLLQVSRFNGRQSILGSWRSNLFLNRGDGTFEPVTTTLSGINEMALASQAVDVDGDGRLEAVLMRREEKNPQSPVMIFWNTGRQFGAKDHHWLKVKLTGQPQRQLIGAKLFIEDASGKLIGRRDYTVDCMRGSHDAAVHFGLGQHTSVRLRVVLPDGSERHFKDVAADRAHSFDVASDLGRVAPPQAASEAPAKPNVIILLADDLGYADVGFQGGKVPTPAIDRLASESVRFTQGYVSASVCSPSRAGLMTGRYQNRFGHETNPATDRSAGTPPSEITIAELLREQGYRTALVGKWHLGVLDEFHPINQGFDEFFGFLHGAHTYFPEQARGESLLRGREPVVEKEYLTDAFAREAVAFIGRNRQTPFFLYLSFNAVHTPLEASRKYLDRFPNLSGNAQTYAAMISAMDDAVGRVMDCLKTQGLDVRTLVFFLDDNGGLRPQASNLPLNGGKATYFEGGIRVPYLARWPGRLTPGEYRHPVISLDILPTALALAGGTLPADLTYDGVNLMPFLTGENSARPHETLFWRMRDMRAEVVRHGDWKYLKVKDEVSLFDLANDLSETRNLAAEKPDLVRDLAARYVAWDKQMAEPLWSFPAEERRERQMKRKNQAAKGTIP